MDEERMSRKMFHGEMEGRRRRGRPRKMWLPDLEKDLRVMQVGRRWGNVQSKGEWMSTVREAKASPGFNAVETEEETFKAHWYPYEYTASFNIQ
jgi:hypothetical protein